MAEHEPMTVNELMGLSLDALIGRCTDWNEEFNEGKPIDIESKEGCPVHMWVTYNEKKCTGDTVPNIAYCPVCGMAMCPVCKNHNVHQLSRVTGYIGNVSGWNEAKKQELKDRTHYDVTR